MSKQHTVTIDGLDLDLVKQQAQALHELIGKCIGYEDELLGAANLLDLISDLIELKGSPNPDIWFQETDPEADITIHVVGKAKTGKSIVCALIADILNRTNIPYKGYGAWDSHASHTLPRDLITSILERKNIHIVETTQQSDAYEDKILSRLFSCPQCGVRRSIYYERDGVNSNYTPKCRVCLPIDSVSMVPFTGKAGPSTTKTIDPTPFRTGYQVFELRRSEIKPRDLTTYLQVCAQYPNPFSDKADAYNAARLLLEKLFLKPKAKYVVLPVEYLVQENES